MSSQFSLLRQRRFAPFFWAQAAGACLDNVVKFSATVLLTYQLQVSWLPPAMAGLVLGALFILPFLLFSATAGQLADKVDKRRLIVLLKNLEIAIAGVTTVGLVLQSPVLLLSAVFLFGLHSTVFGPVKYSYLPQHLGPQELTGGNGVVEMGTFVSILLGNVVGGWLITLPNTGLLTAAQATGLACLALALLGRLAAHRIPSSPASDATLQVNWNAFSETWRNLKLAYPLTAVFRSLLGISWMWLFGSIFLAQFPAYAKDVLHGDEHVASLLLVVFSVGVALGSLMCEWLSRSQVEIGLVPIGALGMTLFAFDLFLASTHLAVAPAHAYTASQFMGAPGHLRVLADLFALSLSAGLFSVPMYALVQLRAPATHRSRIIAANNILNALFMVVGSVAAGIALSAGATIPQLFMGVAVLNTVVAVYIFTLVPEYVLRFLAYLVTVSVYRLKLTKTENIPAEGAALLVANHVSFADAVLLMAASPRPIRFVMYYRIFESPVLGWFFKLARAIPIASKMEQPATYAAAFDAIDAALANDELVCIFPEGAITHDGRLQPFKAGVTKILAARPVPVVPVALKGLWGSFFSRKYGAAMTKPFARGMRSHLEILAAEPFGPERATPEALQARVQSMLDEV